MPRREYCCINCDDSRVERMEKLDADELPPFCEQCGNRMMWAPTSMSFALSGSDWPGKKIKVTRGSK